MPSGAPTLRELRRATADKVAPFELFTTGVEQIDAGGSITYDGHDRSNSRRRVISTDLGSLDASGQYAETPPDWLKNEWVLLCSTPVQMRRIPSAGYASGGLVEEVADGYNPLFVNPKDPCGAITVERPFTGVVPAGLQGEIHAIPPLRGGKSAGIHAAIAHALRVKLREDTVTVNTVTGTWTTDVTLSFPWLTNVGQFVDATYPEAPGSAAWPIPGGRLRFDGDRVLLEPSSVGAAVGVRVLRPVGTWIKPVSTGVWAESTVGLVDDLDQCLGDLDELALLAAFHVADAEAGLCIVGSPEQTFWSARAGALASRLPSLRDQRSRTAMSPGARMWPDFVSVDGPYRGRWGPGFR
jgi:hypothetical protein